MLYLFIILIFLFFIRVPVFLAFLLSTFTYFLINPDLFKLIWIQRFVGGVESIPLLAIPFFVMTGVCMNYTGITKRLMGFCELLIGHKTGSLAYVNILLSTLLGGISGSSLADAAMQSKILVPAMESKGYSKAFSAAVTAFSSQITPIIPPGIALIIYGSISNTSIGQLFVAGILPGIVLCILLLITAWLISRYRRYEPSRKSAASISEILRAALTAYPAIVIPLLIIAGIRLEIMTPSEVGAVAVIITLLTGIFRYKEINLADIPNILKETIIISTNIMLIIGGASILSYIMTWEQVPQTFTKWAISFIDSPLKFWLFLNIFLLIAGMFVEGNALMVILIPILMPIANRFHIDPVHFGIVLIFNLAIGSLTPPVGSVMLTVTSITKVRILDFIRESKLFYITILLSLLLLTFIPEISLFLPRLLYR